MYPNFLYQVTENNRSLMELSTATARIAFGSPSLRSIEPFRSIAAWGEVSERAYSSLGHRPEWAIDPIFDGKKACFVTPEVVVSRPFGNLVHFKVEGRKEKNIKILLVAPMSGHYATLLREQVASLLPSCEVWVTDWNNARDVSTSEGRFGLSEYVHYIEDFITHLDCPSLNLIAVCQPVPLVMAAAARLKSKRKKLFSTLTLIGGPVDVGVAPTQVTDFGRMADMNLLKLLIQRVSYGYEGQGRLVYPGSVQLTSFVMMNVDRHRSAFQKKIESVAAGGAETDDGHYRFYDEYLAVMDMPAEFYLETVDAIFKNRLIPRGLFKVDEEVVDFTCLSDVPIAVVEGGRDDITAPGQCAAAFDVAQSKDRSNHVLAPNSGHYGIFAGKGWRQEALPHLLDFWKKS
mgnify:CR=1 FL=1